MSFLATVGKDIKAVFAWLGSPKGQTIIATTEGVAETVATAAGLGAPVQEGIDLLNKWLTEGIKIQAIGTAAANADPTATNTAKAAAVISTMTPDLTSFLTKNGYVTTNIDTQANTINTAAVALLNALGAPPATSPTPTA